MVQKQGKLATLPGVFSTLSAAFSLTTRYLWLMVIPALLDLFLWLGPRLSFRPLVESLIAQMPYEAMFANMQQVLEAAAPRLNHFTYLSVSFLGVPALMTSLAPERTPLTPRIIERAGQGEWIAYLLLFSLLGLLLAAIFYGLIAYTLRRHGAPAGEAPALDLGRFIRRTGRTWLRLIALGIFLMILVLIIMVPMMLIAGFTLLISQVLAALLLFGAGLVIIWLVMILCLTPQGMTLNPRAFLPAVAESVRLFQKNIPASLGLWLVVLLTRRLLSLIFLSADSGTWLTTIYILAHAYIATALTVAMFIFYRDRYLAFLQGMSLQPNTEQVNQRV